MAIADHNWVAEPVSFRICKGFYSDLRSYARWVSDSYG